MAEAVKDDTFGGDNIRKVRHDIRNQLSNINLALVQLKYEIPDDVGSDSEMFISIIATSCEKINLLLNELD